MHPAILTLSLSLQPGCSDAFMIDLHANADQVVSRFSEHDFTPGCAQHGPEYPDTESPHHGRGLSVHCQSGRCTHCLWMSQAQATRAARTLRIILTVRLTPTASAAQAMMTGMLSDEPAMVTLAHSVHIEAISVPIALGDEQFGQQVVIGGCSLLALICHYATLLH